MTLRKKTLLIIVLTIIAVVALLFLVSRLILLNSFIELEQQAVNRNISRVINAINDDAASLLTTSRDWAMWDDTYNFAVDRNTEYADANLIDAPFLGYRLNLVMFIDKAGELLFERGYDAEDQPGEPLLERAKEQLESRTPLFEYLGYTDDTPVDATAGKSGVVLLPEGPMLMVGTPILNSMGEGPVHGMLVFGRYLGAAEMARLSEITNLSINAYPVNSPNLPEDFAAVQTQLSDESPTLVQPLNAETVAGYALVNDLYGNPALMIRVDAPRDIYQHGETTIFYVVVSLVVTGVIFALVMMGLLESTILSRLGRLTAGVARVGSSGDLNVRVPVEGADELGMLSQRINQTLDELKQAQEAAHESDERLRTVVANAPVIMFATDRKGKIVFSRGQALNALGLKSSESVGKPVLDTYSRLPNVQQSFLRALGGESSKSIAELNGMYFETRYTPAKSPTGEITGVIGVATDITERVLAEEKLRNANEELEHRVKERTLELSETNEQLRAEIDERQRAEAELFDANRQLRREIEDRLHAQAELSAINEQLKLEIEERQRAQEELAMARDQAVQALRTKTQILANVSHDARTPLGAVLGYAEMLQDGIYGDLNDDQNGLLNKIINNTDQLLTFINNLLDSAQIEMKKITIQPVNFNTDGLIEALEAAVTARTHAKGLKLITEIDPNMPPQVFNDFNRLKQILINLVDNAIKFTDKGSIHARLYEVDDSQWALSVKDTGMGIPKEAQTRIYEAFWQVDGSATRKNNSGVGLGLSIVKELVHLMGGQITLESEPGQGSTFTVTLPYVLVAEKEQ